MKKDNYISPEIEIFEIAIEQGFAQSQNAPISDWEQEIM